MLNEKDCILFIRNKIQGKNGNTMLKFAYVYGIQQPGKKAVIRSSMGLPARASFWCNYCRQNEDFRAETPGSLTAEL